MITTKGEATRARILDAAAELLVTGGAERLTLDDVISVTKTSKGQLFHYFPGGRTELLGAATRRQVERIRAVDNHVALDSFTAWQTWIEGVAALHVRQSDGDSCEVAALAGRTLDTHDDERELIGQVFIGWLGLLEGGLRGLQHQGLLSDSAPVDQLASLFVAALEGGAVMDKATGSKAHVGAALSGAMSYLMSFAV